MDYLERVIRDSFPEWATRILEGLAAEPPVSIKVHPGKVPRRWDFGFLRSVPWAENGYYLSERRPFVADPLWHAGAYYVQEASSMFVEFVARKIAERHAGIRWKLLDWCASPGGKTLSLASVFPSSFILANDVHPQRADVLAQNLTVAGYPNVYVTNEKAEAIPPEPFFHIILVDAPCSGEGMYRKNLASLSSNLNVEYVQKCSVRQATLLEQVKRWLLPGGYLIYSTCAFNLEENEKVIERFLRDNKDFEGVFFPVPEEWGIWVHEWKGFRFYRFFPGLVEGEGLSLTVLRRKGELESERFSLPVKREKHRTEAFIERHIKGADGFSFFSRKGHYFAVLKEHVGDWSFWQAEVRMLKQGVFIGQVQGSDFTPSHEWAMSLVANEAIYPCVEVSREQALQFFQKRYFALDLPEKGVYSLRYEGLPLGLVKNIGKRWNSLLPNKFKIRKDLD